MHFVDDGSLSGENRNKQKGHLPVGQEQCVWGLGGGHRVSGDVELQGPKRCWDALIEDAHMMIEGVCDARQVGGPQGEMNGQRGILGQQKLRMGRGQERASPAVRANRSTIGGQVELSAVAATASVTEGCDGKGRAQENKVRDVCRVSSQSPAARQ